VCEAANTCGNGAVETGEGCDDGGTTSGNGCSAACLIETGSACNVTAPGATGGASCASGVCDTSGGGAGVCEAANTCGNGALEAGEGCDDGGTTSGNGCSGACLVEIGSACNATAPGATGSASCASGVCDTSGGGAGVCEAANTCGNGALESGEGCDDGGTTSGNGCSATCFIETGSACNATAPGATGSASCASGVCDTSGGGAGVCEAANTCGNGALESGEGCDDGGTSAGGGCSAACLVETGSACNVVAPGATGSASCASGVCDTSGGAPGVCEAANTCGNGRLEPGEGCDDGGTSAGGGCSASCLVATGSACNGNTAGATGSASCASGVCDTSEGGVGVCEAANTCGNGLLESGEGCDDGGISAGGGCSASCLVETGSACNVTAPGATGSASCASGVCDTSGGGAGVCEAANTCGNSRLEPGEGCDDGGTSAGDGCSAGCRIENGGTCNLDASGATGDASCLSGFCDTSGGGAGICRTAASCGNGVLDPGEGCDDGGVSGGDGCSGVCLVETGAPCNADPAGATDDASCVSGVCDRSGGGPGVCELPDTCGNGVLESGEGCDDGGLVDGDGCDGACLVESGAPCNADGDGVTGDDSCASGVCDASGGAPGVCEVADACGNGLLEAGEGCDDGGVNGDDGCSGACLVETGGACNADSDGATGDDSCASGVCDASGGAPGLCEAAGTCGNGALEPGEGCDDGGVNGGDGCSATCLVETGSPCNADTGGATGSASCASGVCDTSGGAPGVCEAAGTCGNGVLETGEGCDDGGTSAGGGCSASCLVETGSACNADPTGATGDASCASGHCDTTGGTPGICQGAAGCGNGVLEAGEGCDDGGVASGDGCSATCLVETGGACNADSAGATGSASCASGICDRSGGMPGACETANTCGNGRLESGEGCDDGGSAGGDGCSATCLVESGGACNADSAGVTGSASCVSGLCDQSGGAPGVCEAAGVCGNGLLEAGEGCDDGGSAGGDGCGATCLVETGGACNADGAGATGDASCASGVCDATAGNSCAGGLCSRAGLAPGVCEPANSCGNGRIEAGEGCDDGGTAAGDGCSSTCLVEDGGACNGGPGGLTGDASCASGLCDTRGGAPGVCAAAPDTDGDGVRDPEDLDDDNDGIPDDRDGTGDTDGDGVPDRRDLDSDDDGIPDLVEAGHRGSDADRDGRLDCAGGVGANGLCNAVETAPDSGVTDYNDNGVGPDLPADSDADGVPDHRDLDSDDDGLSDVVEGGSGCTDAGDDGVCDAPDSDGDGLVDSVDGRAGAGGSGYPAPPDSDADGTADFRDLDSDGDSLPDIVEAGLDELDDDEDGQIDDDGDDDGDGDGIRNRGDRERSRRGGLPDHGIDSDDDGTPDYRDLDSDGDGEEDAAEAGRDGNQPVDSDGDGSPDFRDPDSDNDGSLDGVDNCRIVANPDQFNDDRDPFGQLCDSDDNGDGIDDIVGLGGGGCQAAAGGVGGGAWCLLLLLIGLVAWRGRRAGAALLLCAALVPAPVRAQSVATEYPIERFRLAGDREGILDVEWAEVMAHGRLDIGLWFGYADDPLNVYLGRGEERMRAEALIESRLGGEIAAAIGLWDWLQLNLNLPLVLSQEQGATELMGFAEEATDVGVGDLFLLPKVRILRQREHGLGLALGLGLTLPSATEEQFFGDRGVVVQPEVTLSRRLPAGLRTALNLGYRAREQSRVLDLVVDDELLAHLGLALRLGEQGGPPLEIAATAALATAADDVFGSFNRNYAELKGGLSYALERSVVAFAASGVGVAQGFGTPDWRVIGGLRIGSRDEAPPPRPVLVREVPRDSDGDGILDGEDRCAQEPESVNEHEDEDGCPDQLPDGDRDGLVDRVDRCPGEAEDLDGFEDDNGCPEADNDKDGVADADDKCRDVAGVPAMAGCPDPDRDGDSVVDRLDNCPDEPGSADFKGCKQKQLVQITASRLEILEVVHFETNRAIIRKKSYPLLDNVAQVLSVHPEIGKVRVEGHTDDRGKDAYNKRLSQQRAEAVVAYLVARGLDAGRLEAIGFGEERPLGPNTSASGRAANRRVEFLIVDAPAGGQNPGAPAPAAPDPATPERLERDATPAQTP
jgi:cysteine-rich repeat protein